MFCTYSSTEERPLAEYLESKLINQSIINQSIDNTEKIQRRAARWILSDYQCNQHAPQITMAYKLPYNYADIPQDFHRFTGSCTTILLLFPCHLTTYLHHIQPDNYICINYDTSSHLFPPPVTNKVSSQEQLSSGIACLMIISI